MKIVIDLPDNKYQWIKDNPLTYDNEYCEAIRKGTPLPEDHGRLIDANALYNDLKFPTKQFAEAFKEILKDAPTVIGVDVPVTDVGKRAESEGKE